MATMTSFLPVNNAPAGGPASPLPADHHHHHHHQPVPSFARPRPSAPSTPSAPFATSHNAAVAAAAPPVPSPSKHLNAKMDTDPEPVEEPRDEQQPQSEEQQQQHESLQTQQQTQQTQEQQQEESTADEVVKEEPPAASASSLSDPTATATATAASHVAVNQPRRHSDDEQELQSGGELQEDAGSDNPESDDGERPAKRKKGQRFFCTEFPPCNLSFTRSEHLARHIRKHTGERPFQCFCTRRFSRLDNLRQHAQTVHVNEEIPPDSLAASVTRMARPVRSDRVRPPGGRARAGTAGNQPSGRGHRRNLSGTAMPPQLASYTEEAARHRPPPPPPPPIVSNDPSSRAKLTVDTSASPPRTPPGQVQGFPAFSQAGPPYYNAPSSARYSAFPRADAPSPYFTSPASSTSAGFWSDTTPRRLSFPTGARPYDIPYPAGPYPPPTSYGPQQGSLQPPQQASQPQQPPSDQQSYSGGASNYLPSPATSSQAPQEQQQQPSGDSDWRRRTWHAPSSSASTFGRQSISGSFVAPQLSSENPHERPASEQQQQQQPPRLPGIESFDLAQSRPTAPPRRAPTPMQIDSTDRSAAAPFTTAASTSSTDPTSRPQEPATARAPPPIPGRGHHRRGNVSIDTALQTDLTRLDLRGGPSPDASQWTQPPPPSTDRPAGPTTARRSRHPPLQPMPATTSQQQESSHPTASSHDRSQSWVGGAPLQQAGGPPPPSVPSSSAADTSMGGTQGDRSASIHEQQQPQQHPEGRGPAFYASHVERRHSYVPPEYLPRRSPPQPQMQPLVGPTDAQPGPGSGPQPQSARTEDREGLGRLEALVAVATSESENQRRDPPPPPSGPRSSD